MLAKSYQAINIRLHDADTDYVLQKIFCESDTSTTRFMWWRIWILLCMKETQCLLKVGTRKKILTFGSCNLSLWKPSGSREGACPAWAKYQHFTEDSSTCPRYSRAHFRYVWRILRERSRSCVEVRKLWDVRQDGAEARKERKGVQCVHAVLKYTILEEEEKSKKNSTVFVILKSSAYKLDVLILHVRNRIRIFRREASEWIEVNE